MSVIDGGGGFEVTVGDTAVTAVVAGGAGVRGIIGGGTGRVMIGTPAGGVPAVQVEAIIDQLQGHQPSNKLLVLITR
jgi:hypothetical protein